jgi:hypothetical protein
MMRDMVVAAGVEVAGMAEEDMEAENTVMAVIVTDRDAASLDGRLKTRRDLL